MTLLFNQDSGFDSGCEQNLIDTDLAKQLDLPLRLMPSTESLSPQLSLSPFPSPQSSLVSGHSWLAKHKPHFDRKKGKLSLGVYFCLNTALTGTSASEKPLMEEPPDLSHVPPEYRNLRQVFNKSKALSLPPLTSYDCSIELFPGALLPLCHLFSLSQPERECVEKYIQKSWRLE